MEIFRRLGVAASLRNARLPADFANDISFRTTVTGKEFGRIPIPCREDRYTSRNGPDTDWPTPEPPHRINQIYLEPLLVACAVAMPGLRLLNRTRVVGFVQSDSGVVAKAEDLDTGQRWKSLATTWLVAKGRSRQPAGRSAPD
jgi:2-polyprenyl-6-methoxyphenol hydroxylase-like FAD-dependent oxidoreductase